MPAVKTGKFQRITHNHPLQIAKIATGIQEGARYPLPLLLKLAYPQGSVLTVRCPENGLPATRNIRKHRVIRMHRIIRTGNSPRTAGFPVRKSKRLLVKCPERNGLVTISPPFEPDSFQATVFCQDSSELRFEKWQPDEHGVPLYSYIIH